MSTVKVKLGDSVTEIPESELAAGYIPARESGGNLLYMEAGESLLRGRRKLHSFPPVVVEIMSRFESGFRDVHPQTARAWLAGFEEDVHPWKEIAIFEWVLERFLELSQGVTDKTLASDHYQMAIQTTMGHATLEAARACSRLQRTGRAKAESILARLNQHFAESTAAIDLRKRELWQLIAPGRPFEATDEQVRAIVGGTYKD